MEIMALPSKEILQFSRDINPWIVKDIFDGNKKTFVFKEDTPEEILELFNKIKDKLGYKVNDYILEDQNQYYISVYLPYKRFRDIITKEAIIRMLRT